MERRYSPVRPIVTPQPKAAGDPDLTDGKRGRGGDKQNAIQKDETIF